MVRCEESVMIKEKIKAQFKERFLNIKGLTFDWTM